MKRLTTQHQALMHAFAAEGRPLSPGELLDVAHKDVPTLNLSTVYRQLKVLLERGHIREVELPSQAPRYALANPDNAIPNHQHYFHCTECDRVFPVQGCPGHIEKLIPQGFLMLEHHVVLAGKCAECNR